MHLCSLSLTGTHSLTHTIIQCRAGQGRNCVCSKTLPNQSREYYDSVHSRYSYTVVVYCLPSASTSKTVASLTPSWTPDSDAGTSNPIRNVSSASTIPSALVLVYIDRNTYNSVLTIGLLAKCLSIMYTFMCRSKLLNGNAYILLPSNSL